MKTVYFTLVLLTLLGLLSGCNGSGTMYAASSGKSEADVCKQDMISSDIKDDLEVHNTEDSGKQKDESAASGDSTLQVDDHKTDSIEQQALGCVYVFVCGKVVDPGVYKLPDNSRICDALEAAGGVTKEGAFEALDQAKPLVDGQTIYVPGKEEEWVRTVEEERAEDNNSDAKGSDGLININTAELNALMTLPGIGQAKALDIIKYREEHGGFQSVEDIMNIQGIKEGVFNKIKDRISI